MSKSTQTKEPVHLSGPLRIRVTMQSKKDAAEISRLTGISETEVYRLAIQNGLKALRAKGKNPLIPAAAAQ